MVKRNEVVHKGVKKNFKSSFWLTPLVCATKQEVIVFVFLNSNYYHSDSIL